MDLKELAMQVAYNTGGSLVSNMLIDSAAVAGGSDNLILNYAKSGLLLEAIERGAHWVKNGRMDPFDVYNIVDDTVFNGASLFALRQMNLLDVFGNVATAVPGNDSVKNAVAMGTLITTLQRTRDYVRSSSLQDTPLGYVTNITKIWY
jgi:hypothetical protein